MTSDKSTSLQSLNEEKVSVPLNDASKKSFAELSENQINRILENLMDDSNSHAVIVAHDAAVVDSNT
jgi:hypothetical protein